MIMPAKKAAKKKATKKSATTVSTAEVRRLRTAVKADQLSKTVGDAVKRALAGQQLAGPRRPILCGIIFRPDTGTFTTVFEAQ
jgi:hypothetical protein